MRKIASLMQSELILKILITTSTRFFLYSKNLSSLYNRGPSFLYNRNGKK